MADQLPYYRYPQNVGSPPFDKWIRFNAKSGRHIIRNSASVEGPNPDRTLASVGLYMTEEALLSDMTVTYLSDDHGAGSGFQGAAIEFFAQTGQNLAGINLSGGISGMLDTVLKDIGGRLKDLASTGAAGAKQALAQVLAEQTIVAADEWTNGMASVVTGQKANPRTDIMFKQQEYRKNRLCFILVPRSLQEAQQIDLIIHFFQFYMLPAYLTTPADAALKSGAWLMGYPYEFEIDFLSNDGGATSYMEHVNKIGRSILTQVSVDHAAGKKTAFIKNNGEFYPVATALTLLFQEVRLLARDSAEINRGDIVQTSLQDPRGTLGGK